MVGAEQAILLSNCNLVYWHMYTPPHLYKLKHVIRKNVLICWLCITWTTASC